MTIGSIFIGQYIYQKIYLGAEILLGYSAKTICSNYFISNFNKSESIRLEDNAIPHLTKLVNIEINDKDYSVVTTTFGYQRTAVYYGRYGCRL